MKNVLCFATLLLLNGCNSSRGEFMPGDCPTAGTFQHFPWVREFITSHPDSKACRLKIFDGTYKGQVVIFSDYIGPACDTAGPTQLFNCHGELIKTFSTPADLEDRNANLKEVSVVYQ